MYMYHNVQLRNENDFFEYSWNHEYFGSLATLQETRSVHDTMNIPKIIFIAYI